MGDIATYSGCHEEIKTHRSQVDLSDLDISSTLIFKSWYYNLNNAYKA